MTWLIYVILSTGEAGPVPVSQYVCNRMAQAMAIGETVTMGRMDGSTATVTQAACLGPVGVDPCEMEALS